MHPTSNCSDPTLGGTTWSTPVLMTAMDPRMLDPFIIFDGTTFTLFYVDLILSTNQSIQYGTSSTLNGTYTKQSGSTNWAGWQNFGQINQEGPALLCLNFTSSCQKWRVYFDQVGNPPGDIVNGWINYSESATGSFSSAWTPYAQINSQFQAKHGTVIPYP
jgi:hypothetical protein